MKPHKHAEAIMAWAEGNRVTAYYNDGGYYDSSLTKDGPDHDHTEELTKSSTFDHQNYKPHPTANQADGHPLNKVFSMAIAQATTGKGTRHGGDTTPFLGQPWAHYADMHGRGFLTGQASKKLEEAASIKSGDAFVQEALGAINYIAMAILKEMEKTTPQD